jgi:anti-anti-sigma regulatory factor
MGAYVDRFSAAGKGLLTEDTRGPAVGAEHVYVDKQLRVSRTSWPRGITFIGEIDASNSHSVSSAIASAMTPGADLHVDVSYLQFCDISGIRALFSAAEGFTEGHRLLLHGMPVQLENVIKVVGWDRLPTLLVCECGRD